MHTQLRELVRRLVRGQPDEWSIGIYTGDSPFMLTSSTTTTNPVLTRDDVSDVQADFIADPFMVRAEGTWHMFFEVLNRRTARGEIGLATSADGEVWEYRQIVLTEPFSLSYPYVFEWAGDYYMVPESRRSGSIRLYRASAFPRQWSFVGPLIAQGYADPSLFRYDDQWWLFAESNPDIKHDTLRLFHALDLAGPWREHPASPIVEHNPRMARPAGRVLVVDGAIIRYTQDCTPRYSTLVRAFEITELTETTYREREVEDSPVLGPSGAGWNGAGMHHIDAHRLGERRWIACVDGRFGNTLRLP